MPITDSDRDRPRTTEPVSATCSMMNQCTSCRRQRLGIARLYETRTVLQDQGHAGRPGIVRPPYPPQPLQEARIEKGIEKGTEKGIEKGTERGLRRGRSEFLAGGPDEPWRPGGEANRGAGRPIDLSRRSTSTLGRRCRGSGRGGRGWWSRPSARRRARRRPRLAPPGCNPHRGPRAAPSASRRGASGPRVPRPGARPGRTAARR